MEKEILDKLLGLFESKLSRPMELYLDMCSRCGVCTPACHAYASMPLPKYSPAYRAEVVRRIYKKYFKAQGKIIPLLGEAKELNRTTLDELSEAAYSCTGCRRCMIYCPFGIDTQQIMSIAKLLLVGANMEPETLSMLADVSVSKGEAIDSLKAGFVKGLERLEQAVIEKWRGHESKTPIPVDVVGADLLYVALAGAHSIIPAAAVFNAAKEHWSLSFFEAVNFGAFVGDPVKTKIIMDRIIDEARRLKVKEVCICECGTAFRVMKQLSGQQPFKVSSITEVHARYLREGRIKVRSERITTPVTYHDPCQIARNGGVIDEPRFILKQLVSDYRELSSEPQYNWCCGGGGGLVALGEDTLDFRMKSAKVKADQVKQTGATMLVTACENCHTQLSDLNEHYELGLDVSFLSPLVAEAVVEGNMNFAADNLFI
ncbi:MAG: (Fe-S)-binding protein [Deltaproteobacteria bacterium]|nr:(Fe-S)-binding protein [Deltaproteobacteria bacterium]